MRMEKFSYAAAEGCLYEAMRWKNKKGKVEPEREGKALIDPSRTQFNINYVHPYLQPKHEFSEMSNSEKERNRGLSIAEWHNSQTGSQSRAVMSGDKKSQAIGLVVTLPRDNPWVQRIALSDDEYNYMVEKMLEHPHGEGSLPTNQKLEDSINTKLKTLIISDKDRTEITQFLKGTIRAWLDECGIRDQDVMFYSIHFDEGFPHAHCVGLKSILKTYETDVYGGRGGTKLLHAKGSTSISYSISPLYEEKSSDENGHMHYRFFDNYHPNIVKKLNSDTEYTTPQPIEIDNKPINIWGIYGDEETEYKSGLNQYGLSPEAREVALHLITGKTRNEGWLPRDMDRERREEGLKLAEAHRLLQIDNRKLENQVTQLKTDKSLMQTELDSMRQILEELKTKNEKEEKALLAAKQQTDEMKAIIKDLKHEFSELIKEIAKIVPNTVKAFITGWKEAKNIAKRKSIDEAAEESIRTQTESLTSQLQLFESKFDELVGDEIIDEEIER